MIFLETVRVRGHSLEPQHVNGPQVGVHLYKRFWIEQTLDSLDGRLPLMIIAARTDTLILPQLHFGHDLSAAGAFLKNAARNLTLFAGRRLDCWFLKNCHGNYARAAVAARTEIAPARFKTRAHSLNVEPVVRTSSINNTRKPRTSAFFRKRKALCKFSIRSARSSAVCVVVYRMRSSTGLDGVDICALNDSASKLA